MEQYIKYQNKIYIPIQVVKISFHKKEELSLNTFQNFILEAIDSGCNLDQIVDATLLTKNVVETEIIQMINQKLLIREDEKITLSDLSKKIQMISKSVINLNKEEKEICINLVTGDIESLNEKIIIDKVDEKKLFIYPKITEKTLDGISLEDNITFLETYMDSFKEMHEDDIAIILNSVFIEFETIGGKKYIEKTIYRIPCIIGYNSILSEQNKNSITAKGLVYKIKYKIESEIVNKYKNVISELNNINTIDNTLLSERGLYVLKQNKICKEYNNTELVCFYDTISGQFCFDKFNVQKSKNIRYNLQLPILYNLSNDIKNNIIKELRKYYNINDENEFIVQEVNCSKEGYNIDFELSDLWSEEYE